MGVKNLLFSHTHFIVACVDLYCAQCAAQAKLVLRAVVLVPKEAVPCLTDLLAQLSSVGPFQRSISLEIVVLFSFGHYLFRQTNFIIGKLQGEIRKGKYWKYLVQKQKRQNLGHDFVIHNNTHLKMNWGWGCLI